MITDAIRLTIDKMRSFLGKNDDSGVTVDYITNINVNPVNDENPDDENNIPNVIPDENPDEKQKNITERREKVNNLAQMSQKKGKTVDQIFDTFINSFNHKDKVQELMNIIENEQGFLIERFKAIYVLASKLHNIIKIDTEKESKIIKNLTNMVYESRNLHPTIRFMFFTFLNPKIPYRTAVNLYDKDTRQVMELQYYFQILKYILRADSDLRDETLCQKIIRDFEVMFDDIEISKYHKMEIADIFLLNGYSEKGQKMLSFLRNVEKDKLYIYNDSQNIHNDDINTSFLTIAIQLMKLEPPEEFSKNDVEDTLCLIEPNKREIFDTVLTRVMIDTSMFRYKNNTFNLFNVFSSLWKWISKHPQKEELYKRLIEEMEYMALYCSSGHLGRFMNVIQGFTDDELLQMRISAKEHIRSLVYTHIDKKLKNYNQDILINMISDNNSDFVDFVIKVINEYIPVLVEEHGPVENLVLDCVKDYCKYDDIDIFGIKLSRKQNRQPPPTFSELKRVQAFEVPENEYILEGEIDCMIIDKNCIKSKEYSSNYCRHNCRIGSRVYLLDAVQISEWCRDNNVTVPKHFKKKFRHDDEFFHKWTVKGENKNIMYVHKICKESYPCFHKCQINGKDVEMNAKAIVEWCQSNKAEHPSHFKYVMNNDFNLFEENSLQNFEKYIKDDINQDDFSEDD